MTGALINLAPATPAELTLREIGPEWDDEWDALAGGAIESGFMQSSVWMRFKRSEGYETRRFGLFEEGRLCGGASLLFYAMPGQAGFLLCPEGPVLDWQNVKTARQGLRLLIAQAQSLAEESGAIGLRIEPHLPPPRPSLLRNWTRAPIDLTPAQTLMLDITQSEEELLRQMRPKGRYNLKLSERHGVTVQGSANISDMAQFYAIFTDTAARQRFFAEPYGYCLNLGAALFPAGQAKIYFAQWQGETIAAILTVFFGRRATYLYGGSLARHRAVMPNYALHQAAIREAQARGCAEYDFYGYDPFGLPDHFYAGISRFKTQWGGQRFDSLGAHDLIFYDRLAERMISRLTETEDSNYHDNY